MYNLLKVIIKNTKKTSNDVILVPLLVTLYIVLVNSIEFEQPIAGRAETLKEGVFKIAVL